MKVLLIIPLIMMSCVVFGQNTYMPSNAPGISATRGISLNQAGLRGTGLKYNDGSFVNEKDADVKGSPFFADEWMNGSVLLATKERIDSVFMKYNLYTDQLQVKVDEHEYAFSIDVREFLLPDPVTGEISLFRSGFTDVPGMSEKSFYKVLYDGKTKLLVKYKKTIGSEMTSTPGVKARVFEDQKTYFIRTASGRMEKIRKKNKEILDLLEGKTDELKKMIDAKKMKLVSDEEIISLLEYYDSLK
jgi:hypothetical protein